MNWGHKIVIVFAVFVSLVMFAIYTATNHRTDLVAEDYYSRELKYQERIDQLNRTISKNYLAEIEDIGQSLNVVFPFEAHEMNIQGRIVFFRPSDQKKDRIFPIKLDSNHSMRVNKEVLHKGRYKVQIEWQLAEEAYFQETEVFVK